MIINKRVVEVALSASPNLGKNYKLTGDTFGFGVLEKNKDQPLIFEANLKISNTCCGIAELGMFYEPFRDPIDQNIINEFIRLWKIIFNTAVNVNVVFAYLPEDPRSYINYRYLINELGFKPIYTFFNPNTLRNVIQYRWEKPNESKKT